MIHLLCSKPDIIETRYWPVIKLRDDRLYGHGTVTNINHNY